MVDRINPLTEIVAHCVLWIIGENIGDEFSVAFSLRCSQRTSPAPSGYNVRKTSKDTCKTARLWAIPSIQRVVTVPIGARWMTMMEWRPIFFLNGCHDAEIQIGRGKWKWFTCVLHFLCRNYWIHFLKRWSMEWKVVVEWNHPHGTVRLVLKKRGNRHKLSENLAIHMPVYTGMQNTFCCTHWSNELPVGGYIANRLVVPTSVFHVTQYQEWFR